MPTVPRFDTPQVQSNTLPNVPMQAARGHNFAIDQAADANQATRNAGHALAQMAVDAQQEANVTIAKDIDTQATMAFSDALYNPESGFMVRRGKDAALGFDPAVVSLQGTKQKMLEGVKNPAVRRLVEPALNARLQHATESASRHAASEARNYKIETAASRVAVSYQDAAMSYDDDQRFVQATDVAMNEVMALAKLNGWDDDTTRLRAITFQDAGHKLRYEAWRMKDPAGAFAHFRENSNLISPAERDNIGRYLFQAAAPVLAERYNAAGGSGLGGPVATDPTAPRGIRNNNPGNIIRGSDNWKGEVQGNDPRYATFESPEAGIRAMGKTLLTYQDKHGISTVEGIIARWAPATENNTVSYAAAVSKEMGVKSSAPLDLRDADTITKLTRAMIRVENGKQPYSDEQISTGLAAALNGTPLPKAPAIVQGSPAGPTGHQDLDSLPDDWRLHVLQLARSQSHRQMAEAREGLTDRVQDATAAFLATGFAPDAPGEAEFIRAYGQDDGMKRYSEFQGVAKLGQTLQEVKTLPATALVEMVVTARPTPGDGFAARQRNYEALVTAVDQVQKARQQDPVTYALQTGSYGLRPIERFGDSKTAFRELERRAVVAGQMSADYRTPPALLTEPEAEAFAQYMSTLQASDKARVLGQVFNSTGAAGIQAISKQLKDKHHGIAIAGMLSVNQTSAGNNAALLYLQGKEALDQKRARIDQAAEIGTKAEIFKAIEGVYQTPQGREAAAEAAFGIYAKFKADGGGDIDQAVNIATGGLMEFNGGKIAKPYGWPDSRFRDALRKGIPTALAARGGEYLVGGARVPAADLGKMLPGARLQTYGQGSYLVMAGNDVVRDATGAPFVLQVGP